MVDVNSTKPNSKSKFSVFAVIDVTMTIEKAGSQDDTLWESAFGSRLSRHPMLRHATRDKL